MNFPPAVCRWCNHPYQGSLHYDQCPSRDPEPFRHEIWPGIFLGSVVARDEDRFVAVVSILTAANVRWIGNVVGMPKCPLVQIDHEDREPGLIAKLDRAYDLADKHMEDGPVLWSCLQGASRSVAALASWRIARHGFTVEQALEPILSIRPCSAHLWPGFLQELEQLAETMKSAHRPLGVYRP